MRRGRSLRAADRCVRWLLWVYPPAFRRAHGLALFELFRDDARSAAADGAAGPVVIVSRALADTIRNAPLAWAETWRQGRWRPTSPDWSGWLHDGRDALRQLRGSPGFAVGVVSMLAIGIGANVTIFTLANAVLISKPTAAATS